MIAGIGSGIYCAIEDAKKGVFTKSEGGVGTLILLHDSYF